MWPRFVSGILGIWLMVAPAVLDYGNPAQLNDRIVGPIIASLAIIAIWETTRFLRWLNFVLGFWLLLAPVALGYQIAPAVVNSSLAGILLVAMSLIRGPIREQYGGGWSALWRK